MSEKISHWAGALSALIAAIALAISLAKYWSDTEASKIGKWQEVAVYEYILENPLKTFREIKIGYIVEAQQITSFSLPKEEIQDDSLRKILLKLQADGLIRLRDTLQYEVVLAVYQPNPQEILDIVKKQQELNDLYPMIKVKVIDLLKRDCGQLNQEEIYRKVSESINIEQHIFLDMLHSMRGKEVSLEDDLTWCITIDSEKVKE